jgi:hypothetical protein
MCGVIISLQWWAPRAEVRQLVSIFRSTGTPTPATRCPRRLSFAARRGAKNGAAYPSFGYSSKTYWLRTSLPAAWFAGEQRWLQLGPSFVDRLTVFYRPYGSDSPWRQKEFGDHASARDNDLDYRESVLILPPPPTAAGYEMVFRLQSSST